MQMIDCICHSDTDSTLIKYYLPFFGIIIVAIIGGAIGIIKIKLDKQAKAHFEWINELRISISNYLTESDHSFVLLYTFFNHILEKNLEYGTEEYRFHHTNYSNSSIKADVLINNIRLLLNPSNKLHNAAEKLLLEREETFTELTKRDNVATKELVDEIAAKIDENRTKTPLIISAIQAIIIDESKKAKSILHLFS